MEFEIYKLTFHTGVHFGIRSLYETRDTFRADTLFSALCIEAAYEDDKVLNALVEDVKSGKLVFSDAMPYMRDTYLIPKPMVRIKQNQTDVNADSGKKFKKIRYIEVDKIDAWMSGEYPADSSVDMGLFGAYETRDAVSVRGEIEPQPYRVSSFHYFEGNGLYLILGYADDEVMGLFEDLLSAVSLVGIGGKRASGYGKFDFIRQSVPESIKERLTADYSSYMLISGGLPEDSILEGILNDASYKLSLRSGFVQSPKFAETQLRKKDSYLIEAGSLVGERFTGRLLNVGSGGTHPVYRYAAPVFLGVVK